MNNLTKLLPYWFLLFTIGFGWFIIAPMFPVLQKSMDVNSLHLLFTLISLYGYAMIVFGLAAGWISNKFNIKFLIYTAISLSVIGLVGRSFFTDSYFYFFLFQIIAATAYPMAMAPVGSMVDLISKDYKFSIIGISVGSMFLGSAFGALFGPVLSANLTFIGALQFAALISIIAGIIAIPIVSKYPELKVKKSLKGTFKIGMLKNFWVGFSIPSMFTLISGVGAIMLVHFKFNFSAALKYAGILAGMAALGAAIGSMIIPSIFEKYKIVRKGIIAVALLSFISAFLLIYLLGFDPSISLMIVFAFLFGFFGNTYWSLTISSMVNYVDDPSQAGFATSMHAVATNLGVAVIPVFLGAEFIIHTLTGFFLIILIELITLILSPFIKLHKK